MGESEFKFITICPRCSSALKVRRVYLGQMVACKQCSHSFVGIEVEAPLAVMPGLYGSEPLADRSKNDERIQVVCESCEVVLSVRRSRTGQVISCKQCGRDILIKAMQEARPEPVLAVAGSTSADDLLHLATSRGRVVETYEPIRSQCKDFESELDTIRVARDLLETELSRLQPAYDLVKAEKARLAERLDVQTRLESDFRSQLETQRCRQSELEEQLRAERESHQAEHLRRTNELDELSEQRRVLEDRLTATEAAWKEYQESNHELFQTQAELETALRSELDSARTRVGELEEELRALRAEVVAPAETVFESVECDPIRPARSLAGCTQEDDVESLRAEIRGLWREFGNLERFCRSVTNTLDGLGIRIDLR